MKEPRVIPKSGPPVRESEGIDEGDGRSSSDAFLWGIGIFAIVAGTAGITSIIWISLCH